MLSERHVNGRTLALDSTGQSYGGGNDWIIGAPYAITDEFEEAAIHGCFGLESRSARPVHSSNAAGSAWHRYNHDGYGRDFHITVR